MPTTSPTTWRLDPDYYTNSAGDSVFNRRAVIVVDVPALSDLSLSYTAANGQTHAMQEAPSKYRGEPLHYSTQHTDNGETRRWFLQVGTNHCDDPVTFHIVDVSRKAGNPKSAPLDVNLQLPYTNGCSPGGGPWLYSFSPSPPTPPGTSSGGSSTCPAGEQLFKICEKCAASVGATPIYHYYEACYTNWSTAQTVYGVPPSSGCSITQVSSTSQCKLP